MTGTLHSFKETAMVAFLRLVAFFAIRNFVWFILLVSYVL